MAATIDSAEDAARTAHDSRAVEALARWGLAARGLVFLVLGALAFSIVLGSNAQADQEGALRHLAAAPLGRPLLVALAVGFLGYAAWLLLEAAVGHRGEDHRGLRRAKSGAKGLVYLALAGSTVQFLARGAGGGSAQSRTAEVLSRPGGRVAVAVVGVAVLGIGGYLVGKGLRRKHADCLEHYRVPRALRRPAIAVGAVGYVGRGVTVGLIGVFLLRASAQSDAQEAKGLDAALQAVASQPYGQVLLALTAIGLIAYALWSFFEAAFREI